MIIKMGIEMTRGFLILHRLGKMIFNHYQKLPMMPSDNIVKNVAKAINDLMQNGLVILMGMCAVVRFMKERVLGAIGTILTFLIKRFQKIQMNLMTNLTYMDK